MTPVTCFNDRSVALFGLGGSGFATAGALKAGGARVAVWDDNAGARDRAAAAGHVVVDLHTADWSRYSALILSPGVPLTHPEPHWTVGHARTAGIEVIGDIELFCRERARLAPRAPFFAITGTNGKSTTTALLAHLLGFFGRQVEMGGNIGTPILDLKPPIDDRCHVIELSTFQIDLTPSLRPSVGILLNLTPDHIDRHGTMEQYAAIKERMVARSDRAVIAVDDPWCAAIADRLAGQGRPVTRVSTTGVPLADGFAADGACIVQHIAGRAADILADLAGLPNLRGRHNAQNAAAAIAAIGPWLFDHLSDAGVTPSPLAGEGPAKPGMRGEARSAFGAAPSTGPSGHLLPRGEKGMRLSSPGITIKTGGQDETLREALRRFPGLPHRMELVGQRGRVLFVNDSKATNANAAEQSLKAFKAIHWIVGGVAKEGGLSPLVPLFDHVTKAYLIGTSEDDFAVTLDGQLPYQRCGTLEAAVQAAASDAAQSQADEPVVLLAPACASYDQFKNFEERGDRFRTLVAALEAQP